MKAQLNSQVLFVPAILLAAVCGNSQPTVWVTHGSERIVPDGPPGTASSIELYAALGEYEPFQVVVRGPASNVDVSVSELIGPGGAKIPKSAMTLYRASLLQVDAPGSWLGPQPRGWGDGLYYLPLIPFVDPKTGASLSGTIDAVPASVSTNVNQPFFVDILVPRDAAPGRYTSTATVTSSQGSASVSIGLNVWNFKLPLRPSLTVIGRAWKDNSKETAKELLRHKVNPIGASSSWTTELVDNYGFKATSIGFWAGIAISDCSNNQQPAFPDPPAVQSVKDKVANYPGLEIPYAYFADEIGSCYDNPGFPDKVKAYAKALQDGGAVPLLTTMPDSRVWIPGPYIWIGAIQSYTAGNLAGSTVQNVRNDPDQQLWSSHVLLQDNTSPKWYPDFPPIDFRIQTGFMSSSIELQGLIMWSVDGYQVQDPWGVSGPYNGHDNFCFPGSNVGISGEVCGMQMKWFREGVEDYEYVALLKQAGEGDWAMEKSREVASGNSDWTKDMAVLMAVRRELGDKLSSLNTPTLNWGERAKARRPVVIESSPAGIRISASRLDGVEIFDLRGNRVPLDRATVRADGKEMLVGGLPPGALIVRVSTGERHETVGFVQF